jgi:hypothetical protein
LKENQPCNDKSDYMTDVYVKWVATEKFGKFIQKLKVFNESNLADLRKLIEANLDNNDDNRDFITLMLEGVISLSLPAMHPTLGVVVKLDQ